MVLSQTVLFGLEDAFNKQSGTSIVTAQYASGQVDGLSNKNSTFMEKTNNSTSLVSPPIQQSNATEQPLQQNTSVTTVQKSNITQGQDQEQNATYSTPESNLTRSQPSVQQQLPTSTLSSPTYSTPTSALAQQQSTNAPYTSSPSPGATVAPGYNPMQVRQQNSTVNLPTGSVQQQQVLPPTGSTIRPPTSSVSTLQTPTTTLPPATVYPPGITTPTTQQYNPYNPYNPSNPYNPYNPSSTYNPYQSPLSSTLPPPYSTYPPSVFPPTTSFATSTSIAPVTGPLSPWFPSVPAISCGGTFSMTVVGAMDTNGDDDDDNDDGNNNNDGDDNDNDDNNDNNDRKLYAFQIQSDGGTALEPESIEGQVFRGENNIERNNGEDFDVKDVFNDCQVVTFTD
jgi:hypothetical protein